MKLKVLSILALILLWFSISSAAELTLWSPPSKITSGYLFCNINEVTARVKDCNCDKVWYVVVSGDTQVYDTIASNKDGLFDTRLDVSKVSGRGEIRVFEGGVGGSQIDWALIYVDRKTPIANRMRIISNSGWAKSPVEIVMTATDDVTSSQLKTKVKADGSSWSLPHPGTEVSLDLVEGPHQISAQVLDPCGRTSETLVGNINVDNRQPQVNFIEPAQNSFFRADETVHVRVNVNDPTPHSSGIKSVKLYYIKEGSTDPDDPFPHIELCTMAPFSQREYRCDVRVPVKPEIFGPQSRKLVVEAIDMAGNVGIAELTIRVQAGIRTVNHPGPALVTSNASLPFTRG